MKHIVGFLVSAPLLLVACSPSGSVDSVDSGPAPGVSSFEPSFEASSAAPQPRMASECDPNYAGGCVPFVPYDLDCPDIGFDVEVVGVDVHEFDRDLDGYGCETYG